jgi:FtsP/CotA-like multicopper oxidase with cupredoxin domain
MLSPAADKATRYNRINGLERTPSSEKPHLLTIVVNKDTYYRVRISAVVYSDSINYVEFIPHDACDVIRPIAYDGVYRSEIPHPTINSPKHFLTVSSRLDVALRCQQDVDIYFHQGQQQLIEGTQTLKMVHVHVQPNSAVDTCIIDSLNSTSSKVVVLTNPQTPSSPYWDDKKETTWNPRRPYYMPDLTDPFQVGQTWVDDTWTVSMDDYFTNGTKAVSVNQIVWDPSVAARSFDLNALVEWNLLRTQSHPFHAHINRMQVVQPGGCGHRYEEGEYFDTITADQDECLVRMKFFDYSGRLVIHCHRFGHEDKGMMTWVDILGGHGHGVKATPQVDCLAAPP